MGFLRFGLSNKKKLPCLKLGEYALPFNQLKYWIFDFPFKAEHTSGSNYLVWDDKNYFITDRIRYFKEWSEWINDYALPNDLKIRKIFDVGCDVGTTMLFFNKLYGVKNFNICDIDKKATELAQKNACLNDWKIDKVFSGAFNLGMLKGRDFDLLKIDIEGGEKELLKLKSIDFPIALEVHGKKLMDDFIKRGFTLKRIRELGKKSTFDGVFIMNNYEEIGFEKTISYEMQHQIEIEQIII